MRLTTLGFVALVAASILATQPSAEAQPAGRAWRIGILAASSRSESSYRIEAFRKGLVELGYTEGKNIAIEYRYAEGKLERLPDLAAEVVRLKTIPIVFTGGDPVRTGLVASLARPGGNVTGLADPTVDVSTKRLELLKEVVPRVSRYPVEVKGAGDLDRAFAAIKRDGAGALLVPGDPMFVSQSQRIRDAAAKNRLPAMYATPEAAAAGGLMAYGTSLADLARRAAYFVDKILKGAKPADLPVEQPTKFELVINMKTAKALGLTIPPSLFLRADR
ncbi:MAG: ABC transporter substrate-binding protein [Candidatus Rokubacteria bacterium]|nr:ABC transporter substrate-binding protein [Candidatus Rokubacteria bacterium]